MNYPPRVIYEQAAQGINAPEAVASVTQIVPRTTFDAGGSYTGVLSDGRAFVVLVLAEAESDNLADAKKAADYAGGVVTGDVARQVSDPVCDALIAAGFGTT